MSNTNKSADIASLRELQRNLKSADTLTQDIRSLESKIQKLSHVSAEEAVPSSQILSTSAAQEEQHRLEKKYAEKKSRSSGIFLCIAVVVFLCALVAWISYLVRNSKEDTYLYTPEIVQEYHGTYNSALVVGTAPSDSHLHDCTINITSCDNKGKLKGYFEFSQGEPGSFAYVYGKYEFNGKVLSKSENGYVTAVLEQSKWIEKPSGYSAYRKLEVKISDNYTSLRCFENAMSLYAAGTERTEVAELSTPELVKSYTGAYKAFMGTPGNATITFDSCDEAGILSGQLDFTLTDKYTKEETHGKYNITGEIRKKYSDGSVEVFIKPGEWIERPEYFSPLDPMTVEIFDQYRSFDCPHYDMHWFYEEPGLTEDPNAEKSAANHLPLILGILLFVVYPITVFVILALINGSGTPKPSSFEQARIDALKKKDMENERLNQSTRTRYVADQKRKNDQEITAHRNSIAQKRELLNAANQKISAATILCSDDKNLETVNFVLDRLERGRADSVKEALLQKDDQDRRIAETRFRGEMALLEQRRRMQWEAEESLNQAMHRANVEREQRKQTEELERIRKELER